MTLLRLPSELIASVFQHLDDDAFLAGRLASRDLEDASLALFGRRFFRKKGYMITTPSLDVLENVARSPRLSKYVTHVWFNPDCYTFITPVCAPEMEIDCDDAEDSSEDERIEITERVDLLSGDDLRKWQTYEETTEDHNRLLERNAAPLQNRLEQILARLSNVKVLGMRRSEDHSPWGWRRLLDAIGEDPRVLGPIPQSPANSLSASTRLFAAMIAAVAHTGTQLQRMYCDVVEVDNLLVSQLPDDSLQRALSSILYLEINVSKAWLDPRSCQPSLALSDEEQYGDGLLQVFRAAAPTLLELGLQIFPEVGRSQRFMPSYTTDVWMQSYRYLALDKVVRNVQFEHLTRVKLEKLVTTAETLAAFLSPSQERLTSLKMRDLRLLNTDEHPKPWEHIFTLLHTSVPDLGYLLLYQLLHTSGNIVFVDRSSQIVATSGLAERGANFRDYDDVTVEASGREEVMRKLEALKEGHWYDRHTYSYAMDEEVWHTDTDEE